MVWKISKKLKILEVVQSSDVWGLLKKIYFIYFSLYRVERSMMAPDMHGKIKYFCRQHGHGYITPVEGECDEDLFVHISDIEGEFVPHDGDEVVYKICTIPPKLEKYQVRKKIPLRCDRTRSDLYFTTKPDQIYIFRQNPIRLNLLSIVIFSNFPYIIIILAL